MINAIEQQIEELNQQVVQLHQAGRYSEAEPLALQACELAKQHLSEHHPAMAISLSNLAELYRDGV